MKTESMGTVLRPDRLKMRRRGFLFKRFFSGFIGMVSLGLILCGTSGVVFAEGLLDDLGIEVEGSMDFFSKYVWRGFTLDRDPVIQPGISFAKSGLTVGLWSSWDAKNGHDSQSDEIDYYVDYTRDLTDMVSVSVGHTFYDFPATDAKSKEFYAGVGLALPVEVSLTWYRDYEDESEGGGDGNYVSLDCGYSIPLLKDKEISLDLGAHAGYNRELFIAGKGYDLGFSLGLTVPLKDNLSMTPTVNYSLPYKDLKDDDDGNQDRRFYAGIGLGYNF